MILNYITWDVSPFIYEGEHFAIGWYGTLVTVSSLFLLVTYCFLFFNDKKPISYAFILFMVSTIFTFYGAHLFQGLFYEWYYAPDNPIHFLGTEWYYRNHYFEQPWKFLDITHGGFASHGCIFGGVITAVLMNKWLGVSFFQLLDKIMLGSCSMMFVRVANLMNSEIYGIPTELPWGFLFNGEQLPCHPTQIYEFIIFLIMYILGWYLILHKNIFKYEGLLSSIILIFIFSFRFLIEFIKKPQGYFESDWVLNMGQWLSILCVVYGIIVYKVIKSKHNE